jgi:hypothetical protein
MKLTNQIINELNVASGVFVVNISQIHFTPSVKIRCILWYKTGNRNCGL